MNKKRSTDALDRPDVATYREQEKFPIVVLLDNVRSLSNVGSIFRTSDAFNVERILLCGITGKPPHREIQRTALGATESVLWEYNEDALGAVRKLRSDGYKVIALEQCERSAPPKHIGLSVNEKVLLVVGNEVEGVSQSIIDIADVCMEIPQLGTKHSLNVTVATGIALWELFSQFSTER